MHGRHFPKKEDNRLICFEPVLKRPQTSNQKDRGMREMLW